MVQYIIVPCLEQEICQKMSESKIRKITDFDNFVILRILLSDIFWHISCSKQGTIIYCTILEFSECLFFTTEVGFLKYHSLTIIGQQTQEKVWFGKLRSAQLRSIKTSLSKCSIISKIVSIWLMKMD